MVISTDRQGDSYRCSTMRETYLNSRGENILQFEAPFMKMSHTRKMW